MFLSFRGLTQTFHFSSILFAFSAAISSPTFAATLVADYRLEGSLKSSIGSPPELKIEGSDYATFTTADVLGTPHPALTVIQNSGAQLNTSGLVTSDHYSIVVLVALDSVNSYRRVLDVKDPTVGAGPFVLNGFNTFL